MRSISSDSVVMFVQLILLTLVVLTASAAGQNLNGTSSNSRIKTVSFCNLTEKQHAGYIDISPTENFFFYLAESRSSVLSDPLVVYLNGGPGGSSIASAFGENGPCKVNLSTGALYREAEPWTSHASILYLDQPFGTGFSRADLNVSDTFVAAEKAVLFLNKFFETFHHLASNDLYLAGASYAGFTIPAIAAEILKGRVRSRCGPVNLKGISLGNPWLDARTAYSSFYDYACVSNPYRKLLNDSTCGSLNSTYVPACVQAVDECYASNLQNRSICAASYLYCESISSLVTERGINAYDVRPGRALPETALLEQFFNLPETKSVLGVDNSSVYAVQSNIVLANFGANFDALKHIGTSIIPEVLDRGIRVLIFNGDADAVATYTTAGRFASILEWSGKEGYAREPTLMWHMGNRGSAAVGSIRSYGTLSVVRVFEAGHLAPLDQPVVTFELFNAFLKNGVKALAEKR